MTTHILSRTAISTLSALALMSTSVFAGNLADPIVEAEVIENVQESPSSSVPGWVIPVVALVAVGALIASNNDDDDDDGGDDEGLGAGDGLTTDGGVEGAPGVVDDVK